MIFFGLKLKITRFDKDSIHILAQKRRNFPKISLSNLLRGFLFWLDFFPGERIPLWLYPKRKLWKTPEIEKIMEPGTTDTTGMSARQAKRALKEAKRAAEAAAKQQAETPSSSRKRSRSEDTTTSEAKQATGETQLEIPDTSGMSAREAKRVKKAAKRAAWEAAAAQSNNTSSSSVEDITKGAGSSSNTATSSKEKEMSTYLKQMNKQLPSRQEKARRDVQRALQSFVADLRAKGVTDKKEVKKAKLKYKKKISAGQPKGRR